MHEHQRLCSGCLEWYECYKHPGNHIEVSCPQENGVYCSYNSYYKCSPHTHAYLSSTTSNSGYSGNSGNGNNGNNDNSNPPPMMTTCSECNTSYETGSSSAYSHRHISSCSETDANGNTCNNTSSYYACSPHSHTYPAPPPPSTPAMESCDAGHTYRSNHPNRTYLDNFHRTRTCRFSGCSNTWQACVDGWTAPLCNNPYRKRNGWNCGAQ